MVRRSVPLAQQVILSFLSQLEQGVLARDDGLIPSETDLAQRFHVSRATIRQALARLELAGVVIRRQGIGTFVNQLIGERPGAARCWFDDAQSFLDLIQNAGQPAECTLLGTEVHEAGELAGRLAVEPSTPVLAVERLFYSASAPVIHTVNVVSLTLVDEEKRREFDSGCPFSSSIYQFLESQCGLQVHHQTSDIRAVVADSRLAGLLKRSLGHPLLRVEDVGYSADMTPVFYGLNHYDGELVSLLQVRRPALNIRRREA